MDPRNTTTIGRSASMSFLLGNLAQDLDLQPERQQQLEGALREIENSLEYRLMLAHDNESEGLHHFDNDSLPSGLRLPDGNGNNSISPFSSPGSDETVKPNARQKTRDGTLSSDSWTHGSSRSLPMNVPQLQHTGQILDLLQGLQDKTAHGQTPSVCHRRSRQGLPPESPVKRRKAHSQDSWPAVIYTLLETRGPDTKHRARGGRDRGSRATSMFKSSVSRFRCTAGASSEEVKQALLSSSLPFSPSRTGPLLLLVVRPGSRGTTQCPILPV